MKKSVKRILATALTFSIISSFNMPKITFAENKLENSIAIDENNFKDAKFREYVKANFDVNSDNQLSKEEKDKVTYIYVNMEGITSLKGIENFTNLEALYAEVNYITDVDLSENTNLRVVYLNNNLISTVKLPNSLEVLSLFDNRLTKIDLGNLNNLTYVNLGDNKLSTLDLNVGKIQSFTASYNELREVTLPSSGVTYDWRELLATQSYHEAGYEFKWYSDPSKTQEVNPNSTPSITLNGQTLYSNYTPIEYTVKFNAGGGNGSIESQSFVYDQPQILNENKFTKDGYNFSGWRDNNGKIYSDRAEVKNLTVKNNATVTLTATWTEKDYTGERYIIKFPNEVTLQPIESTQYGYETTLPKNELTKAGHDFMGWSTTEGGEVVYSDEETILLTNPSQLNGDEAQGVKSLNLYAVWKVQEFNVDFIDGDKAYKNVVKYNENVVAPQNTTKEGYKFIGWVTEGGEPWSNGTPVTDDIKLYAKYSPISYSVSFNGNGADNTDDMKDSTIAMDYSKQAVLPTNVYEKEGYTFKGWSRSQNGEVEFINEASIYQLTTIDEENITLYAVWEKIKEESEITIITESLNKGYDGNVVLNPEVNKKGSNGEVKFTWYQKLNDDWTILESAPSNAGIYKVVATVETDENYKEASSEPKEFEITKAENAWKVEPSINGWKAGETASIPVGKSNFGEVVFTYSNSKEGQFTATVPTEAGTWYMKAVVEGNENYNGLESEAIEFIIEKADENTEDKPQEDESVQDDVIVSDVTISNGSDSTNKFTYGDKIVIKFTITDKTRETKKVALFANGVQVTEAQDAIVGEELTFEYDTKNGLVNATGEVSLKLAYVDGDVIGKEIYTSVISLDKKSSQSEDIKVPEINAEVNLDNLEIKDGDIILKQGVDYDITKTENGDTVNVVITFKGNYSGTITKSYKVESKEEVIKPDEVIEDEEVKLPNTGAVVSNSMMLVLAVGLIIAGGTVMLRKENKLF